MQTDRIKKAMELALKSHGDQKYGRCPYSKHLNDVVNCVERFGFKSENALKDSFVEDLICAAWLHDSVEDTELTCEEIEKEIGASVADIVGRVTDEDGETREEKKAKTYPKIRGNFGATVVKLADRISNIESSFEGNQAKFEKYVKEQDDFYAAVYVPMLADPMWIHLKYLTSLTFSNHQS